MNQTCQKEKNSLPPKSNAHTINKIETHVMVRFVSVEGLEEDVDDVGGRGRRCSACEREREGFYCFFTFVKKKEKEYDG